jgi:hypothetical protein
MAVGAMSVTGIAAARMASVGDVAGIIARQGHRSRLRMQR